MLNRLQVEAECCGINGWDDFINTPWGIDPINLHLAIPASCCIDQTPATLKYCQEDGNQLFYHRSGCHGKIKDSIHQIGCDMKVCNTKISSRILTALICVSKNYHNNVMEGVNDNTDGTDQFLPDFIYSDFDNNSVRNYSSPSKGSYFGSGNLEKWQRKSSKFQNGCSSIITYTDCTEYFHAYFHTPTGYVM